MIPRILFSAGLGWILTCTLHYTFDFPLAPSGIAGGVVAIALYLLFSEDD